MRFIEAFAIFFLTACACDVLSELNLRVFEVDIYPLIVAVGSIGVFFGLYRIFS